jgi:hypothetical protein
MKIYAKYKKGPIVMTIHGIVAIESIESVIGGLYLTIEDKRILIADIISDSIDNAWCQLNKMADDFLKSEFVELSGISG